LSPSLRTSLELDVVGDEVDTLHDLQARMPGFAEVQASLAALGDGRLDVGDRSVESGGGETVKKRGVSLSSSAERGSKTHLAMTSAWARTLLKVSRTGQ
jgi:hypothetical protein